MGAKIHQSRSGALWALARRQHFVVTRAQLLALGFSAKAISHRVKTGRLHRIWAGVYAVGRPELSRRGEFMAAVLACGPGAVLSHCSAAELWEIGPRIGGPIHVSVRNGSARRRPGIRLHRRLTLTDDDISEQCGIPVTAPVTTLIDVATQIRARELEAAINEADKRDLVDPDELMAAVEVRRGLPGAGALGRVLGRQSFTLTDSELERRFLPIAERAGLPAPKTQVYVNGFRVDFYWEIGLVVETDGLRYHRTAAQQANDRLRDQAHAAAGLTPVRFTHAQVRYEPAHVEHVLRSIARRLGHD